MGTGFSRETRLRPPLPEEALDRPREYWNGMALSCGAASLRNRENWGSIPAPGERQPGSLDIANASIAAVATCLRLLSAARHADAARAPGTHQHPCSTFLPFLRRRRRARVVWYFRGQRRRRRRQAAADARWFIKEIRFVGIRAQVRRRGHHGRASIRVPIPVRRIDHATRRSPPSPSCQKRSSTSSTCASSRNGSCGTTSRAPGCPTASRCGASRVSTKS